ncbi:MAG: tetratricopeptide repeat protein [Candidatus Latescibacterota bacterium]|nr:MAG: tetratricopeptide repeat protein [Candidatus Latescibacterota bacterium]
MPKSKQMPPPSRPADAGTWTAAWARQVQRLDALISTHGRVAAITLYLIALALRAVHLDAFRETLLAHVFLMDEAYYHAEAWNLVRGVPNPTDSWFMTPLYPWFLSILFRITGESPIGAYAVQLALGGLAAPMTFALARRLMRATLALIAGLAVASFAPTLFFESLFLVEWMILLALLGASFFALRGPESRLHAVLTGALLGLATLGRGSNLLLLLPLAVWFRAHGPRGMRQVGLLLAGCTLVVSPLLLYNLANARQPLLLTANAGFNLYLGNGPEATGIFVLPEGLDLAGDPLALRFVQRETGRPVTASEASRFWLHKTLDWVRAHPGGTANLFAWKLLLFWNRFSIPQVESYAVEAERLPISRAPFWSSYAIFPMALLGGCIALWEAARLRRREADPRLARRLRGVGLLAACALVYGVSIALFFITDRYRVAVMPWLIVLSVYASGRLLGILSAGRRKEALLIVLLAVLLFWLSAPARLHIDIPHVQRDLLVHDALRYAKVGFFDAALDAYRSALSESPKDAELRDGLARMYSRAGRDTLAIATLVELLREQPELDRSWYNLGNVYRRSRRYVEAVEAYRQSLRLEPRREAAWNNLGETYRALGDTAAAAQAYRRAIEIVPGHAQAHNNLAALRASQGDAEAAEAGFRAAVAANPRYVPAWTNLAILLTDSGRFEEALEAWRHVATLDPENELARRALEQVGSARAADTEK